MEILVEKNGGDFSTIQEAVEAVPYEESAVIRIGEGVFCEKVFCEKRDITLVGAGIDRTILKFDDYANEIMEDGQKRGTFRSYTAFFGGKRVVVRDMTIKNTAGDGRVMGQALAVYADADVCLFENVKMTGCQDTLFCAPLPRTARQKNGFLGPRMIADRRLTKQYYKNCQITGDVDFIFGGADAVFDDCVITCNDRMHVRDYDGAAGARGKAQASCISGDAKVLKNSGADGSLRAAVVASGAAGILSGEGTAVASGISGSEHKLDKDQIAVDERPVNGYITAACGLKGDIGFIFRNCVIKGAPGCEPGSVFLGRPWRDEAKTVFLDCTMDETIAPERFSGWGGITKNQPDTFYGEYGTKIADHGEYGTKIADYGEHGQKDAGYEEYGKMAEFVDHGSKVADHSRKNPWVKDIDEVLARELSEKADEIVRLVCSK